MDEEYMCNTCRIGTVRPIHFSLKQAIVNCDNPDCDSYLEKWPWECIVTKPILNSSDLSKYERESTCSSDSSGVQSDLGSSSLSQYSITDREVENLFYKACDTKFESNNFIKKQDISKSHQPWQFGYENQSQEPFMALDNIFTTSNEMSTSDQNVAANNVLDNGICNEANSDYVKNCDFFELLKEESDHDEFTGNQGNSNTQVNNLDNLESWLYEFDTAALEKDNESNRVNSRPFENGENVPYQSPSKAIIPSVHSAFYEVSPSKINQITKNFNTHAGEEKEDGIGERAKPIIMPNFMSPASSGFSDDYNFNGDLLLNKSLTLNESFSLTSNISHPTTSCETKADHDDSLTNVILSSGNEINSENSSPETRTEYEVSPIEMVTSCEDPLNNGDADNNKNDTINKTNLPCTNTNYKTNNNSFKFQSNEVDLSLETLLCEENNVDEKIDTSIKFPSSENLEPKSSPSIPQCDTRSENTFSSIESQLFSEVSSSKATFDSAEASLSECNINTESCTPTLNESPETTTNEITASHSEKYVDDEKRDPSIEILPAVNKSTMVPKRGRPRKFFNATRQKVLKEDPWSIPEMYLDELNIEVVVGDSSSGRESSLSSSGNERSDNNSCASRLSSPYSVEIENGHPITPLENVRPIIPIENESSVPPVENVPLIHPIQIVVHPNPFTPEEFPKENFVTSSTPKLDLYKPVTLKPELIDLPSVSYFDAALNIGTPSKVRHSVGYGGHDSQHQSDHSSVKEIDSRDQNSMKSSRYLSSILSNMDFDENFCLLGKQESERSLEDCVSINYLNFESDAESALPEDQYKNSEHISHSGYYRDDESQEPPKKGIKSESTLNDLGNKLDESRIVEEDSDSDIPIVTIDDNDDLKLFIPIKKEIIMESEENDFTIHNLKNIKESYSYKKKRKRREKDLQNYHDMLMQMQMQISKFQQLHEIDNKNTLSDSSSYNVKKENFPMIHRHDNFGNIKKEPEYFENLSSKMDCSDRYDVGEYSSSSDFQYGLLEDVFKKESFNSPPKKQIKKEKTERCRNVLKKHSYMNRVIVPVNDYDTTWAKPYSNLPSTRKLKNKLDKSHLQKEQFTNTVQSLEKNPSVPEVLKILSESGWAVMPCNPTINYNVPEHAISPTIVPTALQSQYGNMGSDLVFWSLTDRDVPGPVKDVKSETSKKNYKSKISPLNGYKKDFKGKRSIKTKLSKNFVSKFLDENVTEPDPFNGRRVNNIKKINLGETPLAVNPNSTCVKSFKTKEESLGYFQPSNSLRPNKFVEQANYSSESSSDECIELPDDLLAYEEAKRGGFNVSAPLIQTENIYIPPPSPRKFIYRSPTQPSPPPPPPKKLPKENLNPRRTKEQHCLLKSQDELKSIVTDRPEKEVPNVVCMNIGGKLYVYHRKDP